MVEYCVHKIVGVFWFFLFFFSLFFENSLLLIDNYFEMNFSTEYIVLWPFSKFFVVVEGENSFAIFFCANNTVKEEQSPLDKHKVIYLFKN